MTDLNSYLLKDRRGNFFKAKRIVCKDGFSLSVQANDAAYCDPRNSFGPWAKVEVGFPSEKADCLMDYCEDRERPTGTVYGYVPIGVVEKLIDSHGGMV